MARRTTIRLNDELAAKLDRLTTLLERPRSWVIEQAVDRYVEEELWQVEAIAEALADVKSGNAKLIPHEEVMRHMEEKLRGIMDATPLA